MPLSFREVSRFGVNLTIEEEKVEFPKGKDNLKMYSVSISTLGENRCNSQVEAVI